MPASKKAMPRAYIKDVKNIRLVECSKMLRDGVAKTQIARKLGVDRATISDWVKAGKVGDHLIPPEKEKMVLKGTQNIPLPPLVIQAAELKKEVERIKRHDGAFSQGAAEEYEVLWVRLSKSLKHIVDNTPTENLDPKALKDWVDVLQKLQGQVEAYYANAKPELSDEALTSQKELQQRRTAMAALYKPKSA